MSRNGASATGSIMNPNQLERGWRCKFSFYLAFAATRGGGAEEGAGSFNVIRRLQWLTALGVCLHVSIVSTRSLHLHADKMPNFTLKVLTKDDAPLAARAVLNDAGTYDVATGTGGFNGSLRFE